MLLQTHPITPSLPSTRCLYRKQKLLTPLTVYTKTDKSMKRTGIMVVDDPVEYPLEYR